MQAVSVQNADPVSGTEPQSVIDHMNSVYLADGRDIGFLRLQMAFRQAPIIQRGFSGPEVDISRAIRVGKNDVDVLNGVLIIAEEADKPASPECENFIRIADAVNQPVTAFIQFFYIDAFDFGIFQTGKIQFVVNCHNTFCRADINPPLPVFGNGADFCRGKAVRQTPLFQAPTFHQQNTVVVGADPQAFPAVNKQTDHAGYSRGRVNVEEAASVIAYKPAVTADPDKAIARLRNGVCLRRRHAVCVVIEHRRIPVGIRNRIHKLPLFRCGGSCLSVREADRHAGQQKGQDEYCAEEKARTCSCRGQPSAGKPPAAAALTHPSVFCFLPVLCHVLVFSPC